MSGDAEPGEEKSSEGEEKAKGSTSESFCLFFGLGVMGEHRGKHKLVSVDDAESLMLIAGRVFSFFSSSEVDTSCFGRIVRKRSLLLAQS